MINMISTTELLTRNKVVAPPGENSGKKPKKVPNSIKTGTIKAKIKRSKHVKSFDFEDPYLLIILSFTLSEMSSNPFLKKMI